MEDIRKRALEKRKNQPDYVEKLKREKESFKNFRSSHFETLARKHAERIDPGYENSDNYLRSRGFKAYEDYLNKHQK